MIALGYSLWRRSSDTTRSTRRTAFRPGPAPRCAVNHQRLRRRRARRPAPVLHRTGRRRGRGWWVPAAPGGTGGDPGHRRLRPARRAARRARGAARPTPASPRRRPRRPAHRLPRRVRDRRRLPVLRSDPPSPTGLAPPSRTGSGRPGLGVALSALWLTQFYPRPTAPGDALCPPARCSGRRCCHHRPRVRGDPSTATSPGTGRG